MKIRNRNFLLTELLQKDEEIPYDLLLLADETFGAIEKYIDKSSIYVLKRDNRIIAVYVLQAVTAHTVEIKNIAVDKPLQGQGIGQQLLGDAINRAKGMGFKKIIIGTGNAAIKQLYVYQKIGFEIYDIKHGFFLDNYPKPLYENGIQLKHMIMLKMNIE